MNMTLQDAHHDTHCHWRRRHNRGAAAVELAIVLPVLITLLLGGMDFGRVMYAAIIVSNAARAGAQHGSLHKYTEYTRASWEKEIQEVVLAEMSTLPHCDISKLTTEITTVQGPANLFRVTVLVSYPFDTVVAWPALPHSVQLSSHITMRQIR